MCIKRGLDSPKESSQEVKIDSISSLLVYSVNKRNPVNNTLLFRVVHCLTINPLEIDVHHVSIQMMFSLLAPTIVTFLT